jgi:hypothetical protein
MSSSSIDSQTEAASKKRKEPENFDYDSEETTDPNQAIKGQRPSKRLKPAPFDPTRPFISFTAFKQGTTHPTSATTAAPVMNSSSLVSPTKIKPYSYLLPTTPPRHSVAAAATNRNEPTKASHFNHMVPKTNETHAPLSTLQHAATSVNVGSPVRLFQSYCASSSSNNSKIVATPPRTSTITNLSTRREQSFDEGYETGDSNPDVRATRLAARNVAASESGYETGDSNPDVRAARLSTRDDAGIESECGYETRDSNPDIRAARLTARDDAIASGYETGDSADAQFQRATAIGCSGYETGDSNPDIRGARLAEEDGRVVEWDHAFAGRHDEALNNQLGY